jgi:hypothetical protein
MEQLKALFGENYYIYGPLTKEEAFNVSVDSKATVFSNQWYAATPGEYYPMQSKLICTPTPPAEEPAPSEE